MVPRSSSWGGTCDGTGRAAATRPRPARRVATTPGRALEVDRLISLIRPENVPSWKVARKLGFRPWRGTVRAGMAHVVWSLDRPGATPDSMNTLT